MRKASESKSALLSDDRMDEGTAPRRRADELPPPAAQMATLPWLPLLPVSEELSCPLVAPSPETTGVQMLLPSAPLLHVTTWSFVEKKGSIWCRGSEDENPKSAGSGGSANISCACRLLRVAARSTRDRSQTHTFVRDATGPRRRKSRRHTYTHATKSAAIYDTLYTERKPHHQTILGERGVPARGDDALPSAAAGRPSLEAAGRSGPLLIDARGLKAPPGRGDAATELRRLAMKGSAP